MVVPGGQKRSAYILITVRISAFGPKKKMSIAERSGKQDRLLANTVSADAEAYNVSSLFRFCQVVFAKGFAAAPCFYALLAPFASDGLLFLKGSFVGLGSEEGLLIVFFAFSSGQSPYFDQTQCRNVAAVLCPSGIVEERFPASWSQVGAWQHMPILSVLKFATKWNTILRAYDV